VLSEEIEEKREAHKNTKAVDGKGGAKILELQLMKLGKMKQCRETGESSEKQKKKYLAGIQASKANFKKIEKPVKLRKKTSGI